MAQVVPGMKKLKAIKIDDEHLKVSRYYAEEPERYTEYDTPAVDEEIDRLSLRALLADHMDSDPAARYKLASNAFERALTEIKVHRSPLKDR